MGKHHVTNPNRGSQTFGKGVHINNPFPIQRLHGRLGVGIKPEFRVIVIFNDPSVPLPGPFEKFQSPAERSNKTGREVVRWGDVKHPGRTQAVRSHPSVIQDRTDGGHAAGRINVPDFFISRIFHRINLISSQQLDEKIVEKVRPCADENALGICFQSPEFCQMTGNSLAELPDSPVGHRPEKLLPIVQHHFPLESGPD